MPAAILLVAGPSGAGKSTFIQCLRAGTLPAELTRELPPAAAGWQVFEANDLLKRNIAADSIMDASAPDGGLIVHFDIAFGRRFGIMDYAGDPAMSLVQRATSLVAVSIHPSPQTLQAQFEERLQHQREKRGAARDLWRRAIGGRIRSFLRRARGLQRVDTSRIYARPAELQQCYSDWIAFARALAGRTREGRLICVEPNVGLDGRPTFTIIPNPAEALSRAS